VDGTRVVLAATLLPIIEADRSEAGAPTIPPGGETDREEPLDPGRGPCRAIVLGLGGAAVLGVGLYAPEFAAAIRVARPRPASGRDERAPGRMRPRR
jgi:hypothetical protein